MNRRFLLVLGLLAVAMVLIIACGKSSPDGGSGNNNGFDKTAMLTYFADEQIIPAFTSLQQKMATLRVAADAFADGPSASSQTAAAAAFRDAHVQFQQVEAFSFGPSASASFNSYINFTGGLVSNDISLNGFSIDTTTIESRISSGSYDLTAFNNNSFYSQGFPALGYLLFAPNAIDRFQVNAANRSKYIKDLTARMQSLTDRMVTEWGAYRAAFIGNTESNVGSPIGNLVNSLAYEMDLLKGPRIGWPFGKQSNGQVFETKVEGYYTDNSVALALANLRNLQKIYVAAGSGKGFSDYLVMLGKPELNSMIQSQFTTTISQLEKIPDPLSASLNTQAAAINTAYGDIQKLLTLLKTDLASATGVQISFMDNDGD